MFKKRGGAANSQETWKKGKMTMNGEVIIKDNPRLILSAIPSDGKSSTLKEKGFVKEIIFPRQV